MAVGVPDELYWDCTPVEVGAMLDAIIERESLLERAANLRAGLVASAVYNVHRKAGTAALRPTSFFAGADDGNADSALLPPDSLAAHMDSFAVSHNRRVRMKRAAQ